MTEEMKPYIIDFQCLGESAIGFISVVQNSQLPFEIKRVFWTYYTPESIVRGRHAHHNTEQILVAVCGRIILTTESASGEVNTFILEKPSIGVYIPPNVWHTMQYSHSSVQLVLASSIYDENDYVRYYDEFKLLEKKQ